jgi:biotin transport system substrate-specific component
MTILRIRPRQAAAVALFAGLTGVSAFVRIPLPGVPLTLQPAAVLLSGLLLGPLGGALSQATYVTIGLMGAPVFAQGGGPGYVLNPTFGYLLGFIGGAAAAGAVAKDWRRAGSMRLALAMLLGLAVIYICGVSYFYWNINFLQGKAWTFYKTARIGFLAPLPGDLVKVLLLLFFIKILRKREFSVLS